MVLSSCTFALISSRNGLATMDASTLTPLVGDFSITGARAVMLMVMMVHAPHYKNQRSELMDGAPVSEKI
jgi:hypothetical protein